ncbi:MAG TPA: four helix bundle protein [Sulfurovum sp. UBA12169]|nr:four helix bundle protein [Sulfurovum sp.]DAB40156.1 MAG TPA: four helix bundle protein [Sulfurovum sp. UBA12169]
MSILAEKSYKFAIRIVKLNAYLKDEKKEYTLSKQLLRSGTAIGALVSEAHYAQSKADFINKLSIGLKEANESRYWIRLLKDCDYLNDSMANSIYSDVEELIKILTSSINTGKEKKNDHQ